MAGKKETPIVKAILEALAAKRVYAWRNNSGLLPASYKGKQRMIRLAPSGSPDIFLLLPGTRAELCGVEVKTEDGEQRASQKRWADKAAKHGVRYGIARSVGEALALVDGWAKERRAA